MKRMDKFRLPLLPVTLLAALAAGPVLAQTTTTSPKGVNTQNIGPTGATWAFNHRLSQIVGSKVYDSNKQVIGQIDDILISGTSTGIGATTAIPPSSPRTGQAGIAAGSTAGTGVGTLGEPRGSQQPMAVIQVGSYLGTGNHLITVPLNSLQSNAELHGLVLPNATKQSLRELPTFDYSMLRQG